MGQPDGKVYHPEYGEAIAADHGKRRDLVRQLRLNADEANTEGDRALLDKDYMTSDQRWRYAARCMRASQSIGFGKPTCPADWRLIGQAWLQVQQGDRRVHDWVDQMLGRS